MTFGDQLRAHRQARKLTIAQAAARLGKDVRHIWRLEKGSQVSRWRSVLEYANSLGITAEEVARLRSAYTETLAALPDEDGADKRFNISNDEFIPEVMKAAARLAPSQREALAIALRGKFRRVVVDLCTTLAKL
jgi:transcriptional regulator with XRE-family HTH domain